MGIDGAASTVLMGAARIGLGGAVLALAGCGVLGQGSSGPIEVAGTDSVFDEGRVETACYTFETSPNFQYELNPNADSCTGDVRWVGHDNLSLISVRVQYDSASERAVVPRLEDAGVVVSGTEPTEVDGIEAVAVHSIDVWGLEHTSIYVPLPEGRFVGHDQELRSLFISGHSGSPEAQELLDAVVDSLELRDEKWEGEVR